MKKSVAIVLTLLIVVTLIFPASAVENNDLTPLNTTPIDIENPNQLNDLTARSTVTKYFNERLAFLKGETTDFPAAIPAVRDDESKHREQIVEQGITLVSSTITFESVNCEDFRAVLLVSENLTYSDTLGNYSETIEHKIKVANNAEGKLSVTFDAYQTVFSKFVSSSFVIKNTGAEPLAAGGSAPCIVGVAEGEVGERESGHNMTKYGAWFGMDGEEWCAIFVAWCAFHSNVSGTVIPQESFVPTMFSEFKGAEIVLGENADSQTPQPGDIYFEGTSPTQLSHVGIITEVYSNYCVVVSGNSGNNSTEVAETDVEFDATDFYAYVRPNYATTDHTTGGWDYDASEHWHICESCNLRVDRAAHSLGSWQIDTEEHWRKCSGCNVTFNWGEHSYGGWNYSSSYHWKACTSCGYKINYVSHTLGGWVNNSSQHWKVCSGCGYKANTGSHTYTAGVCSTCRYNPNISINTLSNIERRLK